MEIKCRNLTKYLDVKIIEGSTTIELGLLDDAERIELAKQFISAAEELLPNSVDNAEAAAKTLESVRASV